MNEDKDVVERILHGNKEDYSTLIDKYQLKLQSFLSFHCQNTGEVEYFMHEAFVRAYINLKTYNPDYPFFPWLKTIAINLIRYEIRSRKVLSEDAKDFLLEQLSDNSENENKLEVLRDCLSELDEKQYELLKLRYWEKIGIDKLSKQWQRKPSAIKMQLMRLRESLRKCINARFTYG